MRFLLAAFLSFALAACASKPPPVHPSDLFDNAQFGAPGERVDTSDLFALSDDMRYYVATDIAEQLRRNGTQMGLIEALYKHGQLRLEYDAARTRNAREAFDARSGNCLSLVIMTAAFAKALHIPVTYQSAYLEETWSRSGDLLLASSHVNVTLGHRIFDSGTGRDLSIFTIDFLPPEDIARMRTREISEQTVVAMYANNRAAEAMAQGRLDAAYAWAGEAIRSDAGFAPGYNTLAVVYLRHGDTAHAERVFAHVLATDPDDTRALANLAELYQRQGRTAEASTLKTRLAALEPFPPFHFFNLGLAAAKQQDWRTARGLFEREVDRAGYNDEFHFWLGVADFQLGDVAAARKEIAIAMKNSTTRNQHELYAAKLAWLQSRTQQ